MNVVFAWYVSLNDWNIPHIHGPCFNAPKMKPLYFITMCFAKSPTQNTTQLYGCINSKESDKNLRIRIVKTEA